MGVDLASALVGPALLAALGTAYGALRTWSGVPLLSDAVALPAAPPRVSLVVPACNEADVLEEATRAKLECDYPDLELVLVDDRSTDATGAIADRLAAEDPRVRVVHVRALPDGWLGKVHALHVGVEAATGDLLLLSDADVRFSPSAVRRAVAAMLAEDLDYVTVLPRLLSSSLPLDVAMSYFMRVVCVAGRPWKMADPRSRAAVGSGVFALVRRRALARTRGLPWLALEVTDDVALAQQVKRAGARCGVFRAPADVSLHFYRSLAELGRGVEKNAFAALGLFSVPRYVAVTVAALYVDLAPLIALAAPSPLARALGCVALAALIASQVVVARLMGRGVGSALVPGLGAALLGALMGRALVVTLARGAIEWRGTRYPLSALRAGRRLEPY